MTSPAEAVRAAVRAFPEYRRKTAGERARFLDAAAAAITALGAPLIRTAMEETGLPEARLTGERGRTTGQLAMFARVVREGSWVRARIDHGDPARQPAPKPDLRSWLEPVGPVAVFGASNFPFAYSTAGGDTASALAAGCPVVVKAHPAHPRTSDLVAGAVLAAARETGMPEGVFGHVHGGVAEGLALVRDPGVKAVGFTGSQRGGRAIFDAAAARPDPIPVHAEMGSVNPVVILPSALAGDPAKLAGALAASVTLGAGQFCTNPGLILLEDSPAAEAFVAALAAAVAVVAPGTMLTDGIRTAYLAGTGRFATARGVRVAGRSASEGDPAKREAPAAVFTVAGRDFLADPALKEEVFGPATLVVRCAGPAELQRAVESLPGQLTGTLHGSQEEILAWPRLLDALHDRVGRLLFGGVPTGVEVGEAMMHGGPWPATTDARNTSVGTAAILRFARPVCYQNFPDALLPPALREANPLGILRLVDGESKA